MKGWIALDIDGTITVDKYQVPKEVVFYLKEAARAGWKIAMATGRPYAFAVRALAEFDFPYYFLVQNGSASIEMPEKRLLFTRYISSGRLDLIDRAFEGIESDYLIYAGYEKGDFCYYRPHRFLPKDAPYLEELMERQTKSWEASEEFDPQKIGPFPLAKCFGTPEQMATVARRLNADGCFQVAHIKDPHAHQIEILLVTDRTASKGLGLNALISKYGRGGKVIAAGDDLNDLSLFDSADIRIAMPHAPEQLLQKADLIAPPVEKLGILQALKQVLS